MSSRRSGIRPMSAKAPSHNHQLITKTFNERSNTNNVDKVAQIWTAFGKYIAKTIKTGKGVGIPKFGNFTFTPMQVDLAGSTNPNIRDKQIRDPIFQIAKDFVLGEVIKCGIVHDNGVLRPFEIKGTSGIVPKVKVNYTEIGYYAGTSKDDAKHGCDIVVRDLSDKVKSGQSTQLLIPNVGTFICKGGVAGIKFLPDVVQDARGKTSKAHFVNKLFSSSVNRANLDILDQKMSQGIKIFPSTLGAQVTNSRVPVIARHDNSIAVTNDAENWLKKNLGVTLENGTPSEINRNGSHRRMKRTYSARPGFRSSQSEKGSVAVSEYQGYQAGADQKMAFGQDFKIRTSSKKRRPMSAYSRVSGSSVKSQASIVPQMSRATALDYCRRIATKSVLDNVTSSKFSARDKLSPSELQSILANSKIRIDIPTMKGFLNHLQFPAHGKSCSMLDLIRRCKEW